MDGVDLTKCIHKKRIVGSTNCPENINVQSDFMLASDDYYAIFSSSDGLIGIYNTWKDILQKNLLRILIIQNKRI